MARNREIESKVLAELGWRHAAGLKANACSRVCGVLYRGGSDWDEAFGHIAEHFRRDPSKPSHAVFARRYRNEESLRMLLYTAASKPSQVSITKLTIDGRPTGRPAVEIIRDFAKVIGEDEDHTRLRIFVDCQGKLITAYPAASGGGRE
jgi:hypothetical protein